MVKRKDQNRLTGINPLSYMGVNPTTPPDQTIQKREPTTKDLNFNIGTLWIITESMEIWMLVSLVDAVATWVKLFPNGSSGATNFPTNAGTAIESAGVLNILGDNVIATSGSGNTVSIALTNGTNGQVLIGGGTDPLWENITSMDSSVTITNGANSIDLSVTGGEGINQIDADMGMAVPLNGQINLLGGELINTSASGNTVVVNLDRGTNGEVPIAGTGIPTIYAHITSNNGSVVITNGANTIDVATASAQVPRSVPSFFYYQPTTSSSLIVGTYYLGAVVTMTKFYDFGSNCTTGNGAGTPAIFTAPTTGIYMIGMGIQVPTSTSSTRAFIQTPSGNIPIPFPKTDFESTSGNGIVKLNMGDTIQFGVNLGAFSRIGGDSLGTLTFFWGYQIST